MIHPVFFFLTPSLFSLFSTHFLHFLKTILTTSTNHFLFIAKSGGRLAGKTEVNQGKTYEMYQAKVAMEIPVARLEVSDIKHVTHAEGTCKFSRLTIDGVYLDKIYETKGSESATDFVYPAGDNGKVPILWEAIAAPNNFLEASAQWPAWVEGQDAKQQAYAFNFYPGATMPVLKIYFAEATASDVQNPVSKPRYAVIK